MAASLRLSVATVGPGRGAGGRVSAGLSSLPRRL